MFTLTDLYVIIISVGMIIVIYNGFKEILKGDKENG